MPWSLETLGMLGKCQKGIELFKNGLVRWFIQEKPIFSTNNRWIICRKEKNILKTSWVHR